MNSVIERYKNIPKAAKASYWYVICNLFQKGLAFIAIPLYTRLLSTTEYGSYAVYATWLNIISIFASLSLSAGFFNIGLLKYHKEENRFLSAVQGLSTVSTVIIIILCFIFNDFFQRITGLEYNLLIVMFIQLLFSTPILYWSAKQRFEFRYKMVVIITTTSSVATIVLSVFFIKNSPDKNYSLILGAAIVQTTIGIYFYFHNLIKGKCFFDKLIWKYAASFGITLLPHYLAYSVLNSSDRVMINNLCSSSDAGIYSLACNISIAVNLITAAIDGSLNPWVFQHLKSKDYKKISKVTNYIVLAFGIVVIGCSLVAPELLKIVSTEEYQDARWAMPPVIAGCYFLYLAGCFMRVAFYHERKHVITFASVFAAILNIILNYAFIPKFGFLAAAYTTLVSYIAFSFVHFIAMRKICKEFSYKEIPFDSKLLLCISFIVTFCSLGILSLYKTLFIRYGVALIIISMAIINKNKIIQIIQEIRKI